MQIIDKHGVVTVKLTQAEGRKFRDAAYLSRRIALNVGGELAANLQAAAAVLLQTAGECCPSTAKLDREDAQEPDVADDFAPPPVTEPAPSMRGRKKQ